MSFKKSTLIYGAAMAVPQVLNFLMLPLYTRVLSTSEFGVINTLASLAPLLTIAFSLFLDRSISRLYFAYEGDRDRRAFVGTVSLGMLVLSALMFCLLWLLRGLVSGLLAEVSPAVFEAFLWSVYLSLFLALPRVYFQVVERPFAFFLLTVSSVLATTGATAWFVLGLHQGAIGWFRGAALGNLILLPVALLITIRSMRLAFEAPMFKQALAFSIPLIPAVASAWVLNLSDRLFIEHYLSMSHVGLYSLGYRIAGLVELICGSFFLAYSPLFHRLASASEEAARPELERYNFIYLLGMMYVAFNIVGMAVTATGGLFGAAYVPSIPIVPIVVLGMVFSQAAGVLNLMFYQRNQTRPIMFLMFAAAVSNALLNVLLIPRLGAIGAAYATLISFVLMFALEYWLARAHYFIPFRWPVLAGNFLVLIGLSALLLAAPEALKWPVYLVGFVVSSSLLGLALRFRIRLPLTA